MDFSKAFDKVCHSLLLHKLDRYGIRGNTNRWIEAFLNNRTQKVVTEGIESNTVTVDSGVPQGSVLGPTLFLFYINDISNGSKSKIRLFADDTIAYLTISSKDDCTTLQADLDNLAKWEDKWKMLFHPDKCNVMTISKKRTNIIHDYILHGQTLQRVTSAKYLGCTIRSDLDWSDHIQNITTKSNKTLGFLRRNLNISSTKIKQQAYKSLVRPMVEYASTVWDPYESNQIQKIEMVQRRGARFVKNSYRNRSSVGAMLENLDWKPLETRRKEARLLMMYKIHHQLVAVEKQDRLLPPTRLSRNMHTHSYQIPSTNATYRKDSFFPRTIRDWNALDPNIVAASSPELFKCLVAKQNKC
jgi:ribonuclease P/MRP protein subunit RPP40